MNDLKRKRRKKIPFKNILSSGLIILGIGLISWSMITFFSQNDYYNGSTDNNRIKTAIETVAPVKTDESSQNTELIVYKKYPEIGDTIGTLKIPSLDQKLTIIQGTGDNELKKGVGHYFKSVLPGQKDNCVLSGHRETVFRKLGGLKIGNHLIVKTSAGEFTYVVTGTRIVHANDRTVIVPTKNAVLTLTTCYPFDTPGYKPDRFIVNAALVLSDTN